MAYCRSEGRPAGMPTVHFEAIHVGGRDGSHTRLPLLTGGGGKGWQDRHFPASLAASLTIVSFVTGLGRKASSTVRKRKIPGGPFPGGGSPDAPGEGPCLAVGGGRAAPPHFPSTVGERGVLSTWTRGRGEALGVWRAPPGSFEALSEVYFINTK